jgi:hypothetical protein
MPKIFWTNKTPAAPAGARNVTFQSNQQIPEKRSAYVGPAGQNQPGVISLEANLDGTKYYAGDGVYKIPAGGAGQGFPYTPADATPASPDTMDDEFIGGPGLNAKWTNNSLGSAYNVNQIWPGWLYLRGNNIANDKVDILQAFSPGTADFSFTIKGGGAPRAGAHAMRLIVGNTVNNDLAMINYQFNGSDSTRRITSNKCLSGTWTYWLNTITVTALTTFGSIWFLHIQRIGGTFDFAYSRNGIEWEFLNSNYSISNLSGANCNKMLLQILPDGMGSSIYMRMGIDFIRHNWIILDR